MAFSLSIPEHIIYALTRPREPTPSFGYNSLVRKTLVSLTRVSRAYSDIASGYLHSSVRLTTTDQIRRYVRCVTASGRTNECRELWIEIEKFIDEKDTVRLSDDPGIVSPLLSLMRLICDPTTNIIEKLYCDAPYPALDEWEGKLSDEALGLEDMLWIIRFPYLHTLISRNAFLFQHRTYANFLVRHKDLQRAVFWGPIVDEDFAQAYLRHPCLDACIIVLPATLTMEAIYLLAQEQEQADEPEEYDMSPTKHASRQNQRYDYNNDDDDDDEDSVEIITSPAVKRRERKCVILLANVPNEMKHYDFPSVPTFKIIQIRERNSWFFKEMSDWINGKSIDDSVWSVDDLYTELEKRFG